MKLFKIASLTYLLTSLFPISAMFYWKQPLDHKKEYIALITKADYSCFGKKLEKKSGFASIVSVQTQQGKNNFFCIETEQSAAKTNIPLKKYKSLVTRISAALGDTRTVEGNIITKKLLIPLQRQDYTATITWNSDSRDTIHLSGTCQPKEPKIAWEAKWCGIGLAGLGATAYYWCHKNSN